MTLLNPQSKQDPAPDRKQAKNRNRSIRVPSQQKPNLRSSTPVKFNYLEGVKKKKHWEGFGSPLLDSVPYPVLTECKSLQDQYCSGARGSPRLAHSAPSPAFQQSEAHCSTEPWLPPELIKEGSQAQACSWIIQKDRWAPEQTERQK